MMKTPIPSREIENLSAYLDGQLTASERKQVEARLATNPELRATFEGLRQTRALLQSLPRKRAPRNFTLTPKMAGVKAKRSLAPLFGWTSAMATILLLFVLFFDFTSVGSPTTSSVAYRSSAPQSDAPTLAAAVPEINTSVEEPFADKALSQPETETLPPAVMGSLDSGETTQAEEGIEPATEAAAEVAPMEPEPAAPVITGPMGLQQIAPEQSSTPTVTLPAPTATPAESAERATLEERAFTATPTQSSIAGGGEVSQAPATSSLYPTQIPEQIIVDAPLPTSEAVLSKSTETPPFHVIEIVLAAMALLAGLLALILRRTAR